MARSNHRSVLDDGIFGDDDYAVTDEIQFVINAFRFSGG
jgi:hypothetical protein